MSKSKPIGIRFDDDDFNICKLHSPKKTRQGVVDFVLKQFADLYRVKVNHFEKNKIVSSVSVKTEIVNEPMFSNPIQPQVRKTVAEWLSRKKEIELEEDFLVFQKDLDAATYLSDIDKKIIRTS